MNALNFPSSLRVTTRRGTLGLTALLTVLSPLGLAACDDGAEAPNDDMSLDGEGGDSCIDTERALTLDEANDLGFTAQQLLDLVAGQQQSELSWTGAGMGAPPAGTTNVTVSLDTANPVSIAYVSSEPNPDSSLEIDADCSDRIVIELSASVVTDDGLLAESLDVTLGSSDGASADWRGWLEPAEIGGTFPKDGDADFEFTGLQLSGAHSSAGVSGEVGMELMSRGGGPDGIAAFGLVGMWGADLGEDEGR